ncbi:hypothetical protein KAH55_14735, partial [bacterium]|nr:hypothetical protein [bacterium]
LSDSREMTTSVRGLNRYFTLIADTISPEISAISPANAVAIRNRRPRIQARIIDKLSGIRGDAPDLKLFLDNQFVIGEFDPEIKRFFFVPKQPLAQGRHIIHFQATDRCGNITENISEFTIL